MDRAHRNDSTKQNSICPMLEHLHSSPNINSIHYWNQL